MKRSFYIPLGVAVFFVLLYTLARLALPGQDVTTTQVVAGMLPPAPYPPDFELSLKKLPHLTVSLHQQDEAPAHLPWETAVDFPDIGSPQARKGGCLRICNVGSYPANFLAFGSPTPQFFHYNLFDCINIPLVREHPQTGQIIPGLAEAWAYHDGLLWFRLHQNARYSNGRPVRAGDFALGVLLRHQVGETGIGQFATELRVYGERILALRPKSPGYAAHLRAAKLLHPAEPGFYSEFTPNYATQYAWRIPPTTGAYSVSKTERGRLISLSRNKQWWAKDIKGFRFTHNIDSIEHHFLTDEAQSWELFLRGKLDMIQTRNVVAWQDKLNHEHEQIKQYSFKLQYPMPPYGITINAKQITDLSTRRGLLHAMDMQHAMSVIFRGEAERLPNFATGYQALPLAAQTWEFSPQTAEQHFRAAGYTRRGKDGIWQKNDGTRLSVRLAFTPSEKITTLVSLLSQRAALCGAEIIPDPMSWQRCASLVQEQRHDMLFWATVAGHPLPNYKSSFHSDAAGHDAPFCLKNEEMDKAIDRLDAANNQREALQACTQIESLIQRAAIWLPGWMENRVNVAAWPHVRLPDDGYRTYDIVDSHVIWIEP